MPLDFELGLELGLELGFVLAFGLDFLTSWLLAFLTRGWAGRIEKLDAESNFERGSCKNSALAGAATARRGASRSGD